MFVGYPCLGKTSFFHRYFEPAGYVHINQDTLATRNKCVKAMQEAFREGKSCVIGISLSPIYSLALMVALDNTNRNASTRKHYIDVAKTMQIPIRCVF